LILLTDPFYELPYVSSYMKKKGYTKETLPSLIMQQSHGDHVVSLPPTATHLGYSSTCNLEMFSIGTRLLCCQPHPDFSQAVQEELNQAEYRIASLISLRQLERAMAESGRTLWEIGESVRECKETRNMMHGIIREFFDQ
jgi:GMP synthase-like glutamine amidotransferase